MNKESLQRFIEGIKKARDKVVNGDTGCYGTKHCWSCAMRYHSGLHHSVWRTENPCDKGQPIGADWSFNRPKEMTVAMFDNSIKAAEEALSMLELEHLLGSI